MLSAGHDSFEPRAISLNLPSSQPIAGFLRSLSHRGHSKQWHSLVVHPTSCINVSTYVHIYVYIVCTYTLAFLLYIDYMYRVITVCIQTTAVALTIMQQQVATALCDAAVFA